MELSSDGKFHFPVCTLSSPKNGGPLSLLRISGIPCVAKIRSNFRMVPFPAVELTISTSGNRV